MYNSHAEPTLSIRLLCMVLFAAALLGLAPHATAQEDETGKQHFDQGVAAYNERDYHNALKHFGEAAELEPSLAAEIHLYLGRIAIQSKTWRLAALEILRAKTMGLSEEREREANIALAYVLAYGEFPRPPAPEPGKPFNVRLSLSEGWVDNLALPLTVTTALAPVRKADVRSTIAAGVDYRLPVGRKGELITGYDVFQSLYSDFSNLRLQSHTVSGRYTHEATDELTLSADIGFTYNSLDSDGFMNSFSIGSSAFFQEQGPFFGRVAYNYADLDYKLNQGQDSNIQTIGVTQYYFLPNTKDFISAGYVYSKADASLGRWDYNLHKWFVSGEHEFNSKNRLTGFMSLSSYDYQGFDSLETTKTRRDDLFSSNVRYTHTFTDRVDVFVQYSLIDTNSNLARQDYTSSGISVGPEWRW